MSFEWVNVSVQHGRKRLHKNATVMLVGTPAAIFVWDESGTTIYTNVVNLSTNRFSGLNPAKEHVVLSISGVGACGCG